MESKCPCFWDGYCFFDLKYSSYKIDNENKIKLVSVIIITLLFINDCFCFYFDPFEIQLLYKQQTNGRLNINKANKFCTEKQQTLNSRRFLWCALNFLIRLFALNSSFLTLRNICTHMAASTYNTKEELECMHKTIDKNEYKKKRNIKYNNNKNINK